MPASGVSSFGSQRLFYIINATSPRRRRTASIEQSRGGGELFYEIFGAIVAAVRETHDIFRPTWSLTCANKRPNSSREGLHFRTAEIHFVHMLSCLLRKYPDSVTRLHLLSGFQGQVYYVRHASLRTMERRFRATVNDWDGNGLYERDIQ